MRSAFKIEVRKGIVSDKNLPLRHYAVWCLQRQFGGGFRLSRWLKRKDAEAEAKRLRRVMTTPKGAVQA